MAKESGGCLTVAFILVLAFIMISISIASPLSPEAHLFVEGAITNLEVQSGPKRSSYHTFAIRDRRYKDKVFSNHALLRAAKESTRTYQVFEENRVIGFHIEKGQLREQAIKMYSLKVDGEIIVPLERKWIVKYWNLAIGIFLLFGAFFVARNI